MDSQALGVNMDPIIGGALISGAGSLLGNLFGSSQAAKQAKMQKEFAQNGIRWRVEDAKKAGIHPLYALGAPVTPYSPVSVGDGGFGALGQDLSRAYMATRTEGEKVDLFTQKSQALQLQRLGLENELLAAQIANAKAPTPPFPGSQYLLSGQTQSGPIRNYENVPIPYVGSAVSETGGRIPVPSEQMADRMEDNILSQAMWAVRNQILPNMGVVNPPHDAPPGKEYIWDVSRQEYRLVTKGTRAMLKRSGGVAGLLAPF